LCFFSFTRADRILKGPDFLRLSKTGKKVYNKHFLAIFSSASVERTRLGVTVTKKVGHAATRNRIKRFCREYFRLHRHDLRGNWDINIIAKKEAADLPSEQAFASIENIFNRISNSFDR